MHFQSLVNKNLDGIILSFKILIPILVDPATVAFWSAYNGYINCMYQACFAYRKVKCGVENTVVMQILIFGELMRFQVSIGNFTASNTS